MGSRLLFIAGPEDQRAITDFIMDLGMHLVPLQADQVYTDDPGVLTGCWISPVSESELHPWGKAGEPQVRYMDVRDPIMRFTRSVHRPPYLSTGDIYWNNDKRELARLTLPTFRKIARWVRKNWAKPKGDEWYFGPEARRLVFEEGIIATSMMPGVTLKRIPVECPIVTTSQN